MTNSAGLLLAPSFRPAFSSRSLVSFSIPDEPQIMPRSISRIDRRNAEIGKQLAVGDEIRDAALEGVVFAGYRRIVLELVADDLAQKLVIADFLDKIEAVFQLRDVAAGMSEDDLLDTSHRSPDRG